MHWLLIWRMLLPSMLLILWCAARAPAQAPPTSLQIRIYGDVKVGIKPRQARAATKPFVDRVSREVKFPLELDLWGACESEELNDIYNHLKEFGKRLDESEFGLGFVEGVQFGVLRTIFPKLEPLVVLQQTSSTHSVTHVVLMGKKNPAGRLDVAQCRGRTLVIMDRQPITNRLFLEEFKTRIGEGKRFFQSEVVESKVKNATSRLQQDNKAKYVWLSDEHTLHTINKELNMDDIVMINGGRSDPLPLAAAIGFRERVDALRPDLWQELQSELIAQTRTSDGLRMIKHWGFQGFVKPTLAYEKLVQRATKRYGVYLLQYEKKTIHTASTRQYMD